MQSKSRKNLIRFFDRFNPVFFKVILLLIKSINLFRGKSRVLVFTDSRGAEITKAFYRKNPFSSYIRYFILKYACDVYLCEEKYTSLIDFFELYKKIDKTKYSFILLHCGIVDFAPRPLNSYLDMLETKRGKIRSLGWSEKDFEIENRVAGLEYEGEATYSFLPSKFFEQTIINRVTDIPNLIYIGVNPVLHEWVGHYWRDRPKNINEQLTYDKLLLDTLKFVVPLQHWSAGEIKHFTVDNVHYNKAGFDYILEETKSLVDIIEK